MDNGVRVETPRALVDNVLQLISLPEIYLHLQQTIDDPEHSREQVAEIIAYDPSLSARVLRIANSSYYGFAREIETVLSAVGTIGELDLRNLVLATIVVGSMSALKCRGVNIDEFWLHSLRCGITARLIAKTIGGSEPEKLFLAGMLHDIGILPIYQQDEALADAVKRQIEEQHQLRDQAERELMGFDHAEVGALLIEAWGLSQALSELTRCHHQYQLARTNPQATMILALANLLTSSDLARDGETDSRHEFLIGQLELDENNLTEIDEISEQQCTEVKSIILG
ncbi:MAG: HDOD domain-containing protein [Gammaproteobacteria bacterium]|nr:HDOD domain-containing protein [Gammaproteobacteria bacterium]